MLTAKYNSWIQTRHNRIGFLASDDKANVAPMTALCAIPLIMVAGIAINSNRISR